ncbi:MAG: DUF4474 domain-containing protein [Eubacteriales bacterium]|nr:DUF4474 domain-containing protein [Eubacteriales bacterium]
MPSRERCQLLNKIIHPFGYQYFPCEDVFVSTFDAWQREFGYAYSYDRLAPYFNMVFDSEPVYFNYKNRTWLIEFWKGQYGINTGAEIGIYCADEIVPVHHRKRELFHTVSDEDIPVFSMALYRRSAVGGEELLNLSMSHWWLAGFCMGSFSNPDELYADICIQFPNCDMLCAFTDALIELGYDDCSLRICGSRICFSYQTALTPDSRCFITSLVRQTAQWKNNLFCRIYLLAARPFCSTADRLIYLYFYAPLIFRRCLRLRKIRKHPHHRQKGGAQ